MYLFRWKYVCIDHPSLNWIFFGYIYDPRLLRFLLHMSSSLYSFPIDIIFPVRTDVNMAKISVYVVQKKTNWRICSELQKLVRLCVNLFTIWSQAYWLRNKDQLSTVEYIILSTRNLQLNTTVNNALLFCIQYNISIEYSRIRNIQYRKPAIDYNCNQHATILYPIHYSWYTNMVN